MKLCDTLEPAHRETLFAGIRLGIFQGDLQYMLLSDKRILEELAHGNLVIEPFDQRQLGTNSYDCRLGEWYFQGDANIEVMHLDNPDEIRLYWGDAAQG